MKYLTFYRDISVGDEPTDINFTNHYLDDKSRLLIQEENYIYSKNDVLSIDRIINNQLVDIIKSGAKFNRSDLTGLNIKTIKQSYNALLNKGIIINNVLNESTVNYKFIDSSTSRELNALQNSELFFDKIYLRKVIFDDRFIDSLNSSYICNHKSFIMDQINLFNSNPELYVSLNLDDTTIDTNDKIISDNSELFDCTKNYVIAYKAKNQYEHLIDYFNLFLSDDKKSFSTFYIDKNKYVEILTDRKIMTRTEYLNVKKLTYNQNTRQLGFKLFFDYHFDTRLSPNDLHYSTLFYLEYKNDLTLYYNMNSKSILSNKHILADIRLHVNNYGYIYNFYLKYIYDVHPANYKLTDDIIHSIFRSDFSLDILFDYFQNVSEVLNKQINNLLRNSSEYQVIPLHLINGFSINCQLNLSFFETQLNFSLENGIDDYNKKLSDFIDYFKERKKELNNLGFDIKVDIT
jgi:hypothetical protein